jgi:integrase
MRDEMAATPGEANNCLKVINGLLDYAADTEMIQHNPARRLKKLTPRHPDGFRMWREDEIAAFLMHYVVGDAAHTAFALALCTGAAVSDLVFLGWQNVEGAHIRYRRSKTGNVVRLPILPELAEVLAALPRDRMTFLQTVNGTRRSSKSITGDMNRWVRAAGIGAKDHAGHMLSLH